MAEDGRFVTLAAKLGLFGLGFFDWTAPRRLPYLPRAGRSPFGEDNRLVPSALFQHAVNPADVRVAVDAEQIELRCTGNEAIDLLPVARSHDGHHRVVRILFVDGFGQVVQVVVDLPVWLDAGRDPVELVAQ